MMKDVFLVNYRRTAFTRAHPIKKDVDLFSDTRGDELLAELINEQLTSNGLDGTDIDDLSVGCAFQVKEQWNFGGRYPLYLSNLGDQCATRGIEQQCGSGLAAIRSSVLNIASGASDISMAGGYEHMSSVPMGPSLFNEGVLTVPDNCFSDNLGHSSGHNINTVMNMGLTAELLAEQSGISREEMDRFAKRSQQQTLEANSEGFFSHEILPLANKSGIMVSTDSCPRPETTEEKLSQLNSVFKNNGQITAGNSSPLTTGAALSVLMSEEALQKTGLEPKARIISCADRGVNPELMGKGVVPAVNKALAMAGLTADQIDVWEINEAFSIVPLYAMQMLNIPAEKVNIKGGALALGHPLGATGVRLVGTLSRILEIENKQFGCAAACIGGGQGIAMIIERI